MTQNTNAVTAKNDVRSVLDSDKFKSEVARVLPKHITSERLTRVALTAFIKTPALYQCSRESLFESILRCAQAGLEPDGRLAHLVPYGKVCQVIFDYKGLVALALRNGAKSVYADKVCPNDKFSAKVVNGIKQINHEVNYQVPRGEPYCYYAVTMNQGDVVDFEVMTMDEVKQVRDRSRAGKNGPWVTDFDEMAKKTVLRRMSKRWDLLPEIRDVINADDDTPPAIEVQGVTVSRPIFKEPEPVAEAPNENEAPQPDAQEESFETAAYDPTADLRQAIKDRGIDEATFMKVLREIGVTSATSLTDLALDPQALIAAEKSVADIAAKIKKGQK